MTIERMATVIDLVYDKFRTIFSDVIPTPQYQTYCAQFVILIKDEQVLIKTINSTRYNPITAAWRYDFAKRHSDVSKSSELQEATRHLQMQCSDYIWQIMDFCAYTIRGATGYQLMCKWYEAIESIHIYAIKLGIDCRATRHCYKHGFMKKYTFAQKMIKEQQREVTAANRKIMDKLHRSVSGMIRDQLMGSKNGRRSVELIGYTYEELRQHLEAHFKPGMSWDNYGVNGWVIDHTVPRVFFIFLSPDDVEFKYCWSLSNLRPMWAKHNSSKGCKLLHIWLRGKENTEEYKLYANHAA